MTALLPRLTLGFDNPNKAAALLACLALVGLAGALRARRASSALFGGLFAALAGLGLVLTSSRGGLLAFLCGAAFVVAANRRTLTGRRLVSLLAGFAAVVGLLLACGNPQRFRPNVPVTDQSVANRLLVWRTAPCLMADAPSGWGLGNAGAAFRSWYQPLDRHEDYRTLVSSHLTWLVELGRGGRLAYAAAWMFVLALGALRLKLCRDALPLAVWACLGVAAQFSSVGESIVLWLMPAALLVPAVATFCSPAAAPFRRTCLGVALIGGTALVTSLESVGRRFRPTGIPPVANDGVRLVVGSGQPVGWIVLNGAVMGGGGYGRRLRAHAAGRPDAAYGVARSLADVPADVERLAVCGETRELAARLPQFARLKSLRILSPADLNVRIASKGLDVKAFIGEFAPNCPPDDRPGLAVVPGCGLYLPDWPAYAFD